MSVLKILHFIPSSCSPNEIQEQVSNVKMVGTELNRTQRAQKENEGFFPRQFFARFLPPERLKQASFQATDAQERSLNLNWQKRPNIEPCGTYL